jgi:hypothetical protein
MTRRKTMAWHEFAFVDTNGNINQSYSHSEHISSYSSGRDNGDYFITFGRPYQKPPVVVATIFCGGMTAKIDVAHVDNRSCAIKIINESQQIPCNFMIHAIGD